MGWKTWAPHSGENPLKKHENRILKRPEKGWVKSPKGFLANDDNDCQQRQSGEWDQGPHNRQYFDWSITTAVDGRINCMFFSPGILPKGYREKNRNCLFPFLYTQTFQTSHPWMEGWIACFTIWNILPGCWLFLTFSLYLFLPLSFCCLWITDELKWKGGELHVL